MATVPHLAYPFRLSATGADVVEQDSLDEITQCVRVLVSTVRGTRIEVPDYGIPDQTFTTDPQSNAAAIRSQCSVWEPRAEVALSSSTDQFDELVRNIRLSVEAQAIDDSTPAPIPTGSRNPNNVHGLTWENATMTWAEADFTWEDTQ